MPLVQIRRNPRTIDQFVLKALSDKLPAVTAGILSCKEGGILAPKDIMVEFDDMSPYDTNCKDIHIRVWAHDYPARRGKDLAALDSIRERIAEEVLKHLPAGVSWYVWVLLAPTSYGSDTES